MKIRKKIGLIINPIAGMGGSVGLKGTDGEDIVRRALELGAIPGSAGKVQIALKELVSLKDSFILLTCPGEMGQNTADKYGFVHRIISYDMKPPFSARDTERAAVEMKETGAEMIVFAGGDGTARNIYSAVGNSVLVLGIPTGVKIHSGVFASNPAQAGFILKDFIVGRLSRTREAEVMDIDEDLYRQGILTTKLFGYLKIPVTRYTIQNRKTGSLPGEGYHQEAIAHDVVEKMNDDSYYLIGPGTTTLALMSKLGLDGSLLGVDLVRKNKMVGKDLNERQILEQIKDGKAKLIITPTGSQGFLLGRGNQQISTNVLRIIGKENIIILATPEKISSLAGQPFLIDTGDQMVDKELSGYYRVITGYHQYVIYNVTS